MSLVAPGRARRVTSCSPAQPEAFTVAARDKGGIKMKNTGKLLKAEQVAETLNLARKTVVTMAREGRLPSIRIGRFYRFDPSEIDRWIQQNRHT